MSVAGAVTDAERRLRTAFRGLPDRLLKYVAESFEESPVQGALDEWVDGGIVPEGHRDLDGPFAGSAFLDWFFFNWIPSGPEELVGPGSRRWPVALAFLEEHGESLSPDTVAVIRARTERTWGLWSVTDVRPGGVIDFENVFSRERVTALDHTAARCVERGQMIYAVFTPFEGLHFLTACRTLLPPILRGQVMALREDLARDRGWLTPAECDEFEIAIRDAYFALAAQVLNPPRPRPTNMEGDPIRLVQLDFRLRMGADEAFERLCDLTKTESRERLLAHAERDEQGGLLEIRVPWEKDPPSGDPQREQMVVAEFFISRDHLVVETNSDRRARNAKAMVKRRLGEGAEYIGAERCGVDELLREAKEDVDPADEGGSPVLAEDHSPELQAILEERTRAHYERWLDQELPALAGQSPREAARTERGRELLEALLADFEQKAERRPHLAPDVGALRKKLGI
jgi:hypothetical protein